MVVGARGLLGEIAAGHGDVVFDGAVAGELVEVDARGGVLLLARGPDAEMPVEVGERVGEVVFEGGR